MRSWLLRLPVRFKLLLAFGSILLMSILLLSVGIYTIQKVISYNNLSENIDGINVSSLKMSAELQEFSDRGYKNNRLYTENFSENLEAYNKELSFINTQLEKINDDPYFENNLNNQKLAIIVNSLTAYEQKMASLVGAFKERGFKDHGIEGKLRSSIHDVEEAEFPYDKVSMLMLRRHEKDFFLRKDIKYLDRFEKEVKAFMLHIDTLSTTEDKTLISHSIANYNELFAEIVRIEQKIGLDDKAGLRGAVNDQFQDFQTNLKNLTSTVKKDKEQIVQTAMLLLFSLLAVQLIIGGILVTFYANLLTTAIKEIKSALVDISEGRFPKPLPIKTKDEIAAAKKALNILVERVRTAVGFASDLGEGNLDISYDEKFKDDVLAKSIVQMQKQLNEADKKQKDINWLNEGLAQFSEILKDESVNVQVLADEMIGTMISYLGANQGAIFIIEGEELEAIATYAYGKKKHVENSIPLGNGLVGQCAIEKHYIHMTDVPQDYVKITSGLGESTPTSLLLVPLKKNAEVMGVIELASFNEFTPLHIEYLEKISESIASILLNKKSSEATLILLEEAKEKAATLSAHEEELRQNTEELQATQEEMARQKEELAQTIIHLQKEISIKDEFISKSTKKIPLTKSIAS